MEFLPPFRSAAVEQKQPEVINKWMGMAVFHKNIIYENIW